MSPAGSQASTAGSETAGAPAQAPVSAAELRQRSLLASEALSELSRLSAYSPSAVEGSGRRTPLTRRQPTTSPVSEAGSAGEVATSLANLPPDLPGGPLAGPGLGGDPAGRVAAPDLPYRRPAAGEPARLLVTTRSSAPRERSATGVRDLISGFHSGASRAGRAAAVPPQDATAAGLPPAPTGPSPTPAGPPPASTDAGPTTGATP